MGCCVGKSASDSPRSRSTPTPSSSSSATGKDQFDKELLRAHNVYRARHSSPALKWSPEAAKAARQWAQHLSSASRLEHSRRKDMGENLAYKFGAELTGQETADMWYNEVRNYNFRNPGNSAGTGHFTQMVWAGTTHMGCGRVEKNGTTYVVANYTPPGNVLGRERFEQNVKKAK